MVFFKIVTFFNEKHHKFMVFFHLMVISKKNTIIEKHQVWKTPCMKNTMFEKHCLKYTVYFSRYSTSHEWNLRMLFEIFWGKSGIWDQTPREHSSSGVWFQIPLLPKKMSKKILKFQELISGDLINTTTLFSNYTVHWHDFHESVV